MGSSPLVAPFHFYIIHSSLKRLLHFNLSAFPGAEVVAQLRCGRVELGLLHVRSRAGHEVVFAAQSADGPFPERAFGDIDFKDY